MTQPAPKGDDVAHNAPKSDDEKPSSRAVKLDRLARSLFDPSMCNHIDRKGDDSPNSPDNAANPYGAKKSCSEKGASVPSNRRIDLPWWLRILFACIGGVCVFLAYPDYNLFFLAYIALFFELWAIDSLRPRSAFFVGWLAGTITNTGGFYWISGMRLRYVVDQDVEGDDECRHAQNAPYIGCLDGIDEIVLAVGIIPREDHREKHLDDDEESDCRDPWRTAVEFSDSPSP